MPAVNDLANRGLLAPTFALVGFGRRDWADEDFTNVVYEAVKEHARTPIRQVIWDRLAERCRFVQGTFDDDAAFTRLAATLEKLDADRGTGGNHAFYLAVPPEDFPAVCQQLDKSGVARPQVDGWARVVIEKPFGHDLRSARELNMAVDSVFPEESVFRIDHYLGKETVQNILALRFANQLLDPIWNAHYVDHVQITMAEDIGLGGRAGYYDGIGAARDVIQNHLMQLLALTAMEEPVSFQPSELQTEKIKVLAASQLAKPLDVTTCRGQYTAGWQGGQRVVGLLDEEGFAKDSTTETFAAITVEVDTRRWAGVPFYLRTGKRLGRRVTEIALVFKRAPHLPFDATMTGELGTNAMVIRVQPEEGITLRFGSKVPGTTMEVRDVNMDFSYGTAFAEDSPEPYERLILDVLLGEPSLFPANAEVELAWKIIDPVLDNWATHGKPEPYDAGTWGPACSSEMLRRAGREWRRP
jgi:glucose-6-phosphate 1-dehydrogenase